MQLFHRLTTFLVISSFASSSAFVSTQAQADCGSEIYVIKQPSPPKTEPKLLSQSFDLRGEAGATTELLVTPPVLSFEESTSFCGDKARFADLLVLLGSKKKLGNVQEVVVKGKLSASEISLLENCTKLQLLEADSASGLYLKRFPNLRKLKIHNADLQTVESASELKDLEEILFRNLKSGDSSIAKLGTLQSLHILDLQFLPHSHISANTIALLRNCKQLTEFDMLGINITDEIAQALCKIKTLRFLFLDKPKDTKAFNGLCRILGSLPDLYLSNYLAIDRQKDIEAYRFFPHVRSLTVSGIPQLSEKSINIITELKHLRFLYIRNSQLPEDGLDKLCSLPEIESITLDSTKLNIKRPLTMRDRRFSLELTSTDIDDHSLPFIANIHCLLGLSLRQTKITNDGLICLKDVDLQSVDVSNTKVSAAGIESILCNSSLHSISAHNTRFNPLLQEGLKVIETAKAHNVDFRYCY